MPQNDLFLRACRLEGVERTPVWLMRQAGRYMREYQRIRDRYPFMKMCKLPNVAADITLKPIEILNVDAAILFSDLLIPVEAMGLEIEFIENVGPIIHNPVRKPSDVKRLKIPNPKMDLSFVTETIKILRSKLKVPLIGFAGAPFTIASYIVEGGGSKNYIHTKKMMYSSQSTFHALMERIVETITSFLLAQIEAGAQALQLFDSWAGCLSPTDYKRYILPHSKRVFSSLKDKVPTIHYANGGSTLLELMREAGGDIIGIDWRMNLDEAWRRIGYDTGIQGNLDPAALFASKREIECRVKDILERAAGRPGHIFNLGHGVLPDTPVENVIAMVQAVQRFSQR